MTKNDKIYEMKMKVWARMKANGEHLFNLEYRWGEFVHTKFPQVKSDRELTPNMVNELYGASL